MRKFVEVKTDKKTHCTRTDMFRIASLDSVRPKTQAKTLNLIEKKYMHSCLQLSSMIHTTF